VTVPNDRNPHRTHRTAILARNSGGNGFGVLPAALAAVQGRCAVAISIQESHRRRRASRGHSGSRITTRARSEVYLPDSPPLARLPFAGASVKPGDYPLRSLQSRAAVRRMLEERQAGKTAITLILDGKENEPPRFTPWVESEPGRMGRVASIPPGMTVEEAERIASQRTVYQIVYHGMRYCDQTRAMRISGQRKSPLI